MSNMDRWNKLALPPPNALKQIKGGRLSGMTDINPVWRMEALTEALGPCGIGWCYEIVRTWTESFGEQVAYLVEVKVRIRPVDLDWSEPVPGIGGSALVAKEKNGMYFDDDAPKKALTDALSVAFKALGVGAKIYRGLGNDSKYGQGSGQQRERVEAVHPTRDSQPETPVAARPRPFARAAAMKYIDGVLEKELPKAPGAAISVDHLRVIKDLTGEGKWERFSEKHLSDEELAEMLRIDKATGNSRFTRTIELVKREIRRPEAIDPVFWPPATDDLIPKGAQQSDEWQPDEEPNE
jgi:hypothetical protein